ncbi:enoyl-CoA hydratase-related protein [Kibdelosporangium philippinense]|uniref:Enoyl-CoA hydratase-related protein n=1 Tax=Kibdelosporangium philippinense TaxID=211113 RepID=A0ABS8Z636_9PSEU|nr:enoyl-CoA hydratase-related protein [Kibdelosporangium philippinense]MCE7002902.1 enoyl-CoA hydratase-related protein [Kibdelosporangium philippinense]
MVVDYECRDGVARIHLNRPQRLNAVVPALTEGLLQALDQAQEARVIVLAGRGRAFCSGHDLKEPTPAETSLETRQRLAQIQDVTRKIRAFPGIVIAAVHGYALGAGCEFALGCDLIVADEHAQFGFPEVEVGLSVTGGISALLPKIVGPARAKELLVLGERIPAEKAAAMGLINRVVPPGEHEKVALEMAAQIADRPPVSVSLAKQALDRGLDATLDEALATEVDHAILTSVSGEYRHG